MNNFDEYKKLGEPDKREKSEIWECAIGLQQVDGLTPSEYLITTAKANIDGDISINEVKARLETYYIENPARETGDERMQEADKVSARIVEILGEKTFSLSPTEYINIHKRLFDGIYKFAGKIRDYNISKEEWVLNGDTVIYASATNLKDTLDYDIGQEKEFKYDGLSKSEILEHIAIFISYLWQIHIFGEGNTRTTAVFLIKYLRKLGFKNATNDLFAENSWYFRNALVRANYEDLTTGVIKSTKYLIKFLQNLLLDGQNALKNREMQIKAYNTVKSDNDTVNSKVDTVNDTVLSLLKSNISITASEIAENLGISLATVKRKIKALKDSGIIERIGSDKTGNWKVMKGGNESE